VLVSSDSLTKHVGTLVENGKDQATKEKTEGGIGAYQMPFLGVSSLKTLSSSCN